MNSFEDAISFEFDQVIKDIKADILKKRVPIRIWHDPAVLVYKVLEDFIYNHASQDVNRGTYSFKKGEIISLLKRDPYFLPNRDKLEFIKEFTKIVITGLINKNETDQKIKEDS